MANKWEEYLALDAIAPGDVVLSAEPNNVSRIVRVGTASTMSHAAIAIHPLVWFDAVLPNIRYQVHEPVLVWDGSAVRLGLKPRKGERFLVRRPKHAAVSTDHASMRHTIAKAVIASTGRFAFLDYAQPSAFLPALVFSLGKTRLLKFVADVLDKKRITPTPGPFCSWLVAEIYRDLGLSFNAGSQTLTPGNLKRSRKLADVEARLVGVPVVGPAPIERYRDQLLRHIHATRIALADTRAAFARINIATNSQLAEFNAVLATASLQLPHRIANAEPVLELSYRKRFEHVQADAKVALDKMYPIIARLADNVRHLSDCRLNCANNSTCIDRPCRRASLEAAADGSAARVFKDG